MSELQSKQGKSNAWAMNLNELSPDAFGKFIRVREDISGYIKYGEPWRIAYRLDDIDMPLQRKNELVQLAQIQKQYLDEQRIGAVSPEKRYDVRQQIKKEDLERQDRLSDTDAFKNLSVWAKEIIAPNLFKVSKPL